jgi:hypothetical protein
MFSMPGRILTPEDIEGYITDLFSSFGDIESVSLSQFKNADEGVNSARSRFAHVTFSKKKAVKSALTASDSIYAEIGDQVAAKWGMSDEIKPQKVKHILDKYKLGDTDVEELKRRVDEVMTDFEEREQVFIMHCIYHLNALCNDREQ